MKRVIIFTYYFPPAGGVAVQRFLKFSKYLPEFGWEPIIITVANGSYPYYDESLLKELSPDLRVYRTDTFEPFELYNLLRGKKGKSMPVVAVGGQQKKSFFKSATEYIRANFFIPDARKGWKPYAIKQAEALIQQEKIDAIITTGPPHSTHLIGLALKQKYGIKWIADFRDPWTKIFSNQFLPRTNATIEKDKALETSVLQHADFVTVISPGMQAEFEPHTKTIATIFNGYDESDFSTAPIKTSQKFTIRYVGNLMSSQNCEALWPILANYKNDIQIELIGRTDEPVKESITQAGLNDCVRYLPFVDHKAAVQLMQEASLLLFVIPNVEDNKLILTGKLFEYLAACTNVLSIGPIDGNAAAILQACGREVMIDYADKTLMRSQVDKAINEFKDTGKAKVYANHIHEQFTRKNQTKLLAEKLNSLSQ